MIPVRWNLWCTCKLAEHTLPFLMFQSAHTTVSQWGPLYRPHVFIWDFHISHIRSELIRGTPKVSQPFSPSKDWISWVMKSTVSVVPGVFRLQSRAISFLLRRSSTSSCEGCMSCYSNSAGFATISLSRSFWHPEKDRVAKVEFFHRYSSYGKRALGRIPPHPVHIAVVYYWLVF